MRQGQSACEIVEMPSTYGLPEVERVALVPISDADQQNALRAAASMPVELNAAGHLAMDEMHRAYVLSIACREPNDLTARYYENVNAVMALDTADKNTLWDRFQEMMAQFSPKIEALSQTEVDDLKKVWDEIQWNDLSGQQWYILMRFIQSILVTQPTVLSRGSSSISRLTQTSAQNVPTPTVVPS